MKTEIRHHNGDYTQFYLSIYYEEIDPRTVDKVTKVIRTSNKVIIWALM